MDGTFVVDIVPFNPEDLFEKNNESETSGQNADAKLVKISPENQTIKEER